MKKDIHKCMSCDRIIGVNIQPGNDEPDEVITTLECINCYNKHDWGKDQLKK